MSKHIWDGVLMGYMSEVTMYQLVLKGYMRECVPICRPVAQI